MTNIICYVTGIHRWKGEEPHQYCNQCDLGSDFDAETEIERTLFGDLLLGLVFLIIILLNKLKVRIR